MHQISLLGRHTREINRLLIVAKKPDDDRFINSCLRICNGVGWWQSHATSHLILDEGIILALHYLCNTRLSEYPLSYFYVFLFF